jgi:hypothetical protein
VAAEGDGDLPEDLTTLLLNPLRLLLLRHGVTLAAMSVVVELKRLTLLEAAVTAVLVEELATGSEERFMDTSYYFKRLGRREG